MPPVMLTNHPIHNSPRPVTRVIRTTNRQPGVSFECHSSDQKSRFFRENRTALRQHRHRLINCFNVVFSSSRRKSPTQLARPPIPRQSEGKARGKFSSQKHWFFRCFRLKHLPLDFCKTPSSARAVPAAALHLNTMSPARHQESVIQVARRPMTRQSSAKLCSNPGAKTPCFPMSRLKHLNRIFCSSCAFIFSRRVPPALGEPPRFLVRAVNPST